MEDRSRDSLVIGICFSKTTKRKLIRSEYLGKDGIIALSSCTLRDVENQFLKQIAYGLERFLRYVNSWKKLLRIKLNNTTT